MAQSEFSRGYKEGYKSGYCYQKTGCIAPVSPTAPIPRYPEKSSSYQDGYNRGFSDGRNSNNNRSTIHTQSDVPVAEGLRLDSYIRQREQQLLIEELEEEERKKEKERIRKELEKTRLASMKEIYKSFKEIPLQVKDGWHNVIITNDIDDYMERKVKVSNNKITEYFKDDWIEYDVKYSSDIDSCIGIVKLIRPDGIENTDYHKVYFMNYISDTLTLAEEPVGSGSISFWVDYKFTGGPIEIYIDDVYFGELEMYFPDGTPNSCFTKGVLKVKNKAGKHRFTAKNNWRTWEAEIEFIKDECVLFGLSKK